MTTTTGFIGRGGWLAAVCVAATLAASGAQAASTWNFSSGCAEAAANTGTFGNTFNCSAGAGNPSVAATAWSDTASGTVFATANLAQYSGSGFGVRSTIETLGVTSPNHSLDNSGNTDLMALNFSSSVILNQVTLGWVSGDSDISVLRYSGAGVAPLAGKTVANLLTSGWELVGSYADLTANTAKTINPLAKSSSWWLVSAYNAGFGGAAIDATADYVKVLSVAGTTATTTRVPEPGSLALVLVALVGGAAVRRRGQAAG